MFLFVRKKDLKGKKKKETNKLSKIENIAQAQAREKVDNKEFSFSLPFFFLLFFMSCISFDFIRKDMWSIKSQIT